MRSLYIIDERGVYTGETTLISDKEGRKLNQIPIAPPTLQPGEFAVWKEGIWEVTSAEPASPPGTIDGVIAERKRRLAEGFNYDFSDARGIHHIGTTERDMDGWDEVTTWSNAQLALGNQTATMPIVTDTGATQVTAIEWQHILVEAAEFRQPLWMASFALQAMDPIPDNYQDDSWWLPPEP